MGPDVTRGRVAQHRRQDGRGQGRDPHRRVGRRAHRAHREVAEEGHAPDAVCVECQDDRKGQPIAGLEIIRGGKKAEGKDVWEGGKILDPENGKEYRASFTPIDGGAKLEVRGYLGPFWRTQVWQRMQ